MPFFRPILANCHSSSLSFRATVTTWSRSALSEKCAPYEQQPEHQLGRALGEYALAAATEDALPRREEEGDVDLPLTSLLFGIVEA